MIRLYDAQKKEKLAVINQTLSRWDVLRCYSSVASRNREPLERDYALLLLLSSGWNQTRGPKSKHGMHIHQGHNNKVRFT